MIPFIRPANKMTRWTVTITTWGSPTWSRRSYQQLKTFSRVSLSDQVEIKIKYLYPIPTTLYGAWQCSTVDLVFHVEFSSLFFQYIYWEIIFQCIWEIFFNEFEKYFSMLFSFNLHMITLLARQKERKGNSKKKFRIDVKTRKSMESCKNPSKVPQLGTKVWSPNGIVHNSG